MYHSQRTHLLSPASSQNIHLWKDSHEGKILYEGLTEEEYFDKMQDLADEYYANGTPHPLELRTSITENGKNV